MRKRIITLLTAAIAILLMTGCAKQEPKTMRLLHWNIQNGMWDGQNDNYDRFVNFVRAQDPDVCVVRGAVHLEDRLGRSHPERRTLPGGTLGRTGQAIRA